MPFLDSSIKSLAINSIDLSHQIVLLLVRTRPPGGALMECYGSGDSVRGYRIRAEARNVGDTQVIAKTGRHKARRVILTEDAEAIIERKLMDSKVIV